MEKIEIIGWELTKNEHGVEMATLNSKTLIAYIKQHESLQKELEEAREEKDKYFNKWKDALGDKYSDYFEMKEQLTKLKQENAKLKDDLGDKSVETYFKLSDENTQLKQEIKQKDEAMQRFVDMQEATNGDTGTESYKRFKELLTKPQEENHE